MMSSSPRGRGVSPATTRRWTACQSAPWIPNRDQTSRGRWWSCQGDGSVRLSTGLESVVYPAVEDRPRPPPPPPPQLPSSTLLWTEDSPQMHGTHTSSNQSPAEPLPPPANHQPSPHQATSHRSVNCGPDEPRCIQVLLVNSLIVN